MEPLPFFLYERELEDLNEEEKKSCFQALFFDVPELFERYVDLDTFSIDGIIRFLYSQALFIAEQGKNPLLIATRLKNLINKDEKFSSLFQKILITLNTHDRGIECAIDSYQKEFEHLYYQTDVAHFRHAFIEEKQIKEKQPLSLFVREKEKIIGDFERAIFREKGLSKEERESFLVKIHTLLTAFSEEEKTGLESRFIAVLYAITYHNFESKRVFYQTIISKSKEDIIGYIEDFYNHEPIGAISLFIVSSTVDFEEIAKMRKIDASHLKAGFNRFIYLTVNRIPVLGTPPKEEPEKVLQFYNKIDQGLLFYFIKARRDGRSRCNQ